ncbi:MAG: TolC family protein [Bacteroidales bacterium]|nr:TolC family protein [Bacteroidales bacterium]
MKTKWLLILLLAVITTVLNGQVSSGDLSLSLEEAQEYAILHNKTIKASKLDIEAARMSTWEAISGGLPTVDGNASINDNLKLMTTLLPGEFMGLPPGEKVPIQFGSKYNTSYGIQISQLLFNASYFVGVQTAKLAEELSEQGLEKSELEIKELVISTYYLILVTEESLKILDENRSNLKEILDATQSMFSVGMAEETDVDQMISNVSMVDNTRRSMERNIEVSYNLMRFQLGVEPETVIILTQLLENFIEEVNVIALSAQDFDLHNNIDYRLLSNQERLSELAVKMQKSTILPTLAGFYSYNESGMGDKLNDLQWFPNSMIGMQLSVPIFASGQRYSKIKRAEFDLQKIRTNKSMVSDQLKLQEKQLRYNLLNANEQFQSQKDNVEVAKRIYASVENKYKQGMASSLDLTQANGNYLDAENNYISSLMSLLQTKLALDKILNNL